MATTIYRYFVLSFLAAVLFFVVCLISEIKNKQWHIIRPMYPTAANSKIVKLRDGKDYMFTWSRWGPYRDSEEGVIPVVKVKASKLRDIGGDNILRALSGDLRGNNGGKKKALLD